MYVIFEKQFNLKSMRNFETFPFTYFHTSFSNNKDTFLWSEVIYAYPSLWHIGIMAVLDHVIVFTAQNMVIWSYLFYAISLFNCIPLIFSFFSYSTLYIFQSRYNNTWGWSVLVSNMNAWINVFGSSSSVQALLIIPAPSLGYRLNYFVHGCSVTLYRGLVNGIKYRSRSIDPGYCSTCHSIR